MSSKLTSFSLVTKQTNKTQSFVLTFSLFEKKFVSTKDVFTMFQYYTELNITLHGWAGVRVLLDQNH